MLKSCLFLLLQQKLKNVEIIIVNDNPTIQLSHELSHVGCDMPLRILTMCHNGGYAAACNYGVQNARGDMLVFMDSDILVTNNWLENLLKSYTSTANCGAVSTTIMNLNKNRVVHWGLEVIKPFRDGVLPKQIRHGIYEFSMASSGCILVPKEVFIKAGGFDEQFYNGFCDLDLTYKITRMGFKCIYCSEAVVYHRGKISGITRTAAEDDTRSLFMRKWSADLPDDGLDLLKNLYCMNISTNTYAEYLMVNFSRSLWVQDYHSVLLSCLNTKAKSIYDFKTSSTGPVILEDCLPWNLCGLCIPIIYFVDSITTILDNQHWFMHRLGKGDMMADKNGNLIMTDHLLI